MNAARYLASELEAIRQELDPIVHIYGTDANDFKVDDGLMVGGTWQTAIPKTMKDLESVNGQVMDSMLILERAAATMERQLPNIKRLTHRHRICSIPGEALNRLTHC